MFSMNPHYIEHAIEALHYAYPGLSFLYFMSLTTLSICRRETVSQKRKDQCIRRDVLLALMILVIGTYAASAINLLVRTVVTRSWGVDQHETVYLICAMLVWGIPVLILLDTKFPVWYPYYGIWFIAAISEIILAILSNVSSRTYGVFELISLSIQCLRVCTILALLCIYLGLRARKESYGNWDAERQALIRKTLAPKQSKANNIADSGNGYGAVSNTETIDPASKSDNSDDSDDGFFRGSNKARERVQRRLENDGNWWTYVKGFSILFPYVWPVHDKLMQSRAFLVVGCLLTSNFLNIMIPRQLGIVTDSLVNGHTPWIPAAIYAILKFLNSSSCIGWLQFSLWRPLEQYAYQALSTAAHQHVMNLSSDFHDNKEASDIHRAVTQGQSITSLVELVCFEIIPTLIDLVAVCIYLNYLFGPYMGLILAITSLLFLYVTTKLVSMSGSQRRLFLKSYRKEWSSVYTSIDNWRTASYFNNIPYEEDRYSSNVRTRLLRDKNYRRTVYFVTASQGLIMTLGLLGACFLAIYQVTHGLKTPGAFIILITYWMQLQGPLNFFSNVYKKVSESMMDAEHLLELFKTKPTIIDHDNAQPLEFKKGEVIFDHVHYHYDPRKPTLKDINFTVPGGSTIALVGETGSGKSTIVKLLDRFYDVTSGSIKIDGQDIRDVTLRSLREKIGVVPQDPMLFCESIMNNIRYAKLSASNEEVYEACRAAAIHDKIMTFPDGYNSKVGSKGVKLSGGERQRVAIARAILKHSDIIVLDEATSAVDSDTEQLIQEAFKELTKGRTTFVVAHRLSTIMRADRILVIKNGEIIENGSHDELIHSKGKYSDLWSKQILVKPEERTSRSPSPGQPAPNIVNDVKSQAGTTTLATALRGTDHSESNCTHFPTKTVKGKGAKLKADASEFIPRHIRESTESASYSKHIPESKEPEPTISGNQQTKQAKDDGDSSSSIAKSAKATRNNQLDSSDNICVSDDVSESQCSRPSCVRQKEIEDDSVAAGNEFKNEMPKIKLPYSRYGRRNQSKSEPTSQINSSFNSTQGSDGGMNSTGETQPLLSPPLQMNYRRVTAPSDPPATYSNARPSSRSRPARRARHWRLRSKAARSSIMSGGSNSRDVSTDDGRGPIGPLTTPLEGVVVSSTHIRVE